MALFETAISNMKKGLESPHVSNKTLYLSKFFILLRA
jgi:hypothetical protein